MKVIFLKATGGNKRGDIKEAAEGYARNFLLPQGWAILATPENISKIKNDLGKQVKQKQGDLVAIKSLADRLKGKKIDIKSKANEVGKLYAAVSESEVKNELKRLGFNLKEAKIVGLHHLKEAGDYKITVDFGHGINSNITVSVKI